MTAPLNRIRILDFSRVLSGPFASMHLADLGADVVKVERPGRGDDTRGFGPPFADDVSTYFLSINRGKRSLTLDLKDETDLAIAKKLAQKADVVLENFRPGVMQRLGLGWDSLSKANPGLIFCSISGFGQQAGPKAGYDLVIQGLSGVPHLTGDHNSPPYKCGASVADLVAGLNAVQSILAALVRRERTGQGARVDVSMIDSQRALLAYHASAWLNGGVEPQRIGNAHPSIHPFCAFQAADGFINIAVGNDRLWSVFLDALESVTDTPEPVSTLRHERFASNAQRVEQRNAVNQLLAPMIATRSVAFWLDTLETAGVPAGPIATVPEALETADTIAHPHPTSGQRVHSLPPGYRISDAPRAADRRAPRLGEHTDAVLTDWLKD